MTRRILFDARYVRDSFGGIGRYAFELLRALPAAADPGDEIVALVDPGAGNGRHDLDALRAAGVRLEVCRVPLRSWTEQRELPRRAASLGASLVHTPYAFTAWRWPCPWVATLHDLLPLRRRDEITSPITRLGYRVALAIAVRSADALVTGSDAARRDVERAFPFLAGRVWVAPNGVDPGLAVRAAAAGAPGEPGGPQPVRDGAGEAAAWLRGLPRRYVLCLADHRAHHNVDRLLAAWWTIAPEARAGHELVVAGRTPPVGVDGVAGVRWAGEVPEAALAALYRGATVFVRASTGEGFGLPVLEAMACGAPVACADDPALAEVAGPAAAVFDPFAPASVASTLTGLLADPDRRCRLVVAGDARWRELTWTRTAGRTYDAYRRTLARPGRRVSPERADGRGGPP